MNPLILLIGCNMSITAVKLSHVSKRYQLHSAKPTLIEQINPFEQHRDFWALKNVNLTIHQGDHLGIIGLNGAGKTTILRLIAGITKPTQGSVYTHGKIVSLIELSAGFHPDFPGIDNIYLNGLLLGMKHCEVTQKLKQIIDFADIGDFINQPFYTYSSGMALRLGFSIAVNSQPDIILLDENVAAGDVAFSNKIYSKINEFTLQSKTIIFASHILELVDQFCPRSIWLENGRIKTTGSTKTIINLYRQTSQ